MQSRSSRVPRALASIAAAVVVLLVLTLVTGAIAARQDAAYQEAHPSIAAPHVGDRGYYALDEAGAAGFAFEIGSPTELPEPLLGDGQATPIFVEGRMPWRETTHSYQRFQLFNQGRWDASDDHIIWASGDMIIARQSMGSDNSWGAGNDDLSTFLLDVLEEPEGACLFRSPVHGPHAIGDTMELPGPCGIIDPENDDADRKLKVLGREERDGSQTVHYRIGTADRHTDLWYQPHIPYPVQVRIVAPEATPKLLNLTGFIQGDERLPPPEPVAIDPFDLERAPREVWGTPDQGVDHPFPLSEAFTQAREAPQWPQLRLYLSSHPEAQVFYTRFDRNHDDLGDSMGWELHFVDGGGEVTWFHVTRTERDGGVFDAGAHTLFVSQDDEPSPLLDRAPPLDKIPATAPTAASLLAARGPESSEAAGIVNAWSYGVFCTDGCDAVVERAYTGWIGAVERRGTDTQEATLERDNTFAMNMLLLDGQGMPRAIEESMTHRHQRTAPTEVVLQSDEAAIPPAPPADSTQWSKPSAPVAASITIFTILSFGLAWWWPKLVATGSGLFSRISGKKLLDHPARKAIMEAVNQTPGIHLRQLLRHTALANGTCIHHLRKLVEGGFVVEKAAKGFTSYFAAEMGDRKVMAAAAALKSEGARTVLAAVMQHEGASLTELSADTGLAASTVNYHTRRLIEADLVHTERDGHAIRHYVSELALRCMPPPEASGETDHAVAVD